MDMFPLPSDQGRCAGSQIKQPSVSDVTVAARRRYGLYAAIHAFQVRNHSDTHHTKKTSEIPPRHDAYLIGAEFRILYSEVKEEDGAGRQFMRLRLAFAGSHPTNSAAGLQRRRELLCRPCIREDAVFPTPRT